VKLADFGLLTDENIDSDVVAFLRSSGFDVRDVCESGWRGMSDSDLLRQAVAENRLIVTHDADFGTLAIRSGEPVVGIVYLRPGHILARFTTETLAAVFAEDPDVRPPFVLVARRAGDTVHTRVRHLAP
jgi:predicted nuclease of predicted toxin-antitoxin system